jgi:hypothetical protein
MSRLRMVLPLFAVGFVLSGGFLMGEDKKGEKEPIIIRAPQMPRYFKQLGLSDKQKKDIALIQTKYAAEIKKLNDEIAALREKSKADVENVLTAAQKARLREIRGGGPSADKEEKPAEAKKK